MSVDTIIEGIKSKLDSNAGVDYIQLNEQVMYIKDLADKIAGLLITIIIIGIPIITCLELMYINIPIIQDGINNVLEKYKSGGKVLGLVLRDGRLALERANTVETGKSVNGVYIGIKLKSILIAVVLVVLVLEFSGVIVEFIIKLGAWVLESIE